MTVYGLVLLLHVLASSVWIGAGILAPADVRDTLANDPTGIPRLLMRLRRTAGTMNVSAYLTVASGFALVLLGRGIQHTPPRIWAGLGLTLLAIGVGRWLIRPAIVALAAGITRPLTTDEVESVARRFALGVHGEGVLRVIVLALMLA